VKTMKKQTTSRRKAPKASPTAPDSLNERTDDANGKSSRTATTESTKSSSMLVRASRDGDQFHYWWAARRCLRLLSPTSGLTAVTIEGASSTEFPAGKPVEDGEEIIDVGEYFGSEDVTLATLVRYIQLKHSTLHADEAWTPSGLEATIGKFAKRYIGLRKRLGEELSVGKLECWFVSNRPIDPDFKGAIEDAAGGIPARSASNHEKLEKFTGLHGSELGLFCKCLRIEGSQEGYWSQRNLLFQDYSGYLPEADIDGPVQLKELVTQKALSHHASSPSITKMDVLRALKTDESGLFPAPCLVTPVPDVVPREQESELVAKIVGAEKRSVLLHAAAGVGKTVFSTRIQALLPAGSMCVLYDCFGNGEYRSPSRYRHRHKTGLVQIANELAGKGSCHPLIPAASADSSAYLRAFLYRLKQSVATIRAENPAALLCIVVDAADNAQLAADEISEPRSFIRDLLREELPEGVRLVALCRTERQALLDPTAMVLRLELRTFSRDETAIHLRHCFPHASERDVDEFHSLSSHNPRVQTMAVSRGLPLSDVLRLLGPNPTTVEMAIGSLLEDAVTRVRDLAVPAERMQIESVCRGLAILRPLIPISVLASMSGVSEAAIMSFAVDLGRPLHVAGATIQFFDEPAETWFRERFKATSSDLVAFLEVLKPLASSSPYVASVVPQLMLEAGQIGELVDMALSSDGLPNTSRIERRDIELQRLQFALKASLRRGRHADTAKLALKAGGESAGYGREAELLQSNTDLVAKLFDTDRIQEIVSRRTFGSGWVGSQNAYEAGLMSGKVELVGEARSRLRMAEEWLWNWSRLNDEQRGEEEISDLDIAELGMAHFQIHGAEGCAKSFRGWTPREVSFRSGRVLARRFVDHARYSDLDDLATAAGNDIWLLLAITLELRNIHRNPPSSVVRRALSLLAPPNEKLEEPSRWQGEHELLAAVVAVVESAIELPGFDQGELIQILTRYLPDSPPRGLSSRYGRSRFTLLRVYALRAALTNQVIGINDLAYPELRQKMERGASPDSQEVREFREGVGALLPWHTLWADALLGRVVPDAVSATLADVRAASANARGNGYREDWDISNEIARLWLAVLLIANSTDASSVSELHQWIASRERPLFTPTLTELARLSARTGPLHQYAHGYAHQAFVIMRDARENADSKAEVYVDLARALLALSAPEAKAYFDEAIEVAGKVGDENLARWAAMLDLADSAADRENPAPKAAYGLSRCAELTYEYVVRDKHFDWMGSVRAIAGLCPSSSLTILSRWRDRRFGRDERLLPATIEFLLERCDIDCGTALAFLGFRAEWDPVNLVERALRASVSTAEKSALANFAFHYLVLNGYSSKTWQELKALLASHGLTVPGVDELANLKKRTDEASSTKPSGDNGVEVEIQTELRNWDVVFEGVNLTTAEGVSLAYTRFRNGPHVGGMAGFFEEACERIQVGAEAEFIRTLPSLKDASPYEVRVFIEHVPDSWRNRLSVRDALRQMLEDFCRVHCLEIRSGRGYDLFPFDLAAELCNFTKVDVADHVLSALGQGTDPLRAERLFSLVGLVALKLSKKEALEALTFGLNLYDDVLKENDGDGPWSARIEPPLDVEGAVAGYVWAGLAAPKTSVRWESAHVVRGLCALGRENVVTQLLNLAKADAGGAFAATGLHFYNMHARLWLLIAFARAAKENPSILAPHSDFLLNVALNSMPHVLIRAIIYLTYHAA